MDSGGGGRVVTARLASGVPVRVVLAEPESGDGMTSVGLRDLELDKALEGTVNLVLRRGGWDDRQVALGG